MNTHKFKLTSSYSPSTVKQQLSSDLDVSLVVPIYNEVESLPHLIEAIAQVMTPEQLNYEIICVDDGSTDGSTELLKKIAQSRNDVCAILLRRNYGQTPAMAAGRAAASLRALPTAVL